MRSICFLNCAFLLINLWVLVSDFYFLLKTGSLERCLKNCLCLKEKATLKENIIKMKDILFPNILVQIG